VVLATEPEPVLVELEAELVEAELVDVPLEAVLVEAELPLVEVDAVLIEPLPVPELVDVVVLATEPEPVLVELEAESLFVAGAVDSTSLAAVVGLVATLIAAMLFLRFDSNIC